VTLSFSVKCVGFLKDKCILVDVSSQVNYLNLKLQGKDKLFPSLVNDISASMHSR